LDSECERVVAKTNTLTPTLSRQKREREDFDRGA
jgi:hypothetical protein